MDDAMILYDDTEQTSTRFVGYAEISAASTWLLHRRRTFTANVW